MKVPAEKRRQAEKARSVFRHDLRTSFNVLIGYCEMCLEEVSECEGSESVAQTLELMLKDIRVLLREAEYAIESANIETEELFRVEISAWLKKTLLGAIQGLIKKKKQLNQPESCQVSFTHLELAFKRLTQQCLNPFVEAHFIIHQKEESEESKESGECVDCKGLVLIIDDQADNLFLLKHRMEKLDVKVVATESPLRALELVKEKNFDVIFVDLDMPEMSGIDFLRALAKQGRITEIPTLVITASDNKEVLSECINIGAVDFLPKPFENSILKARLKTSLTRKKSQDREKRMALDLRLEKARVDELLSMVLPPATLAELKETGTVKPRRFSDVAVLFCDIVNFTSYCEVHEPEDVLKNLHSLFSEFDAISEMYGIQKIKTIGDSYMAAAGLVESQESPLQRALQAAFAMIEASRVHSAGWQVRVGINVGDVIGGIAGTRQYLFDLWGDTVNTAARLESAGLPMTVTMLADKVQQLPKNVRSYPLGEVELKGKGALKLVSLKFYA